MSIASIIIVGNFSIYLHFSPQVYIAEISSAKFRGFFGSFVQIGLVAEILVNYVIGSIPHFPYYRNSLVAAGIAAGFEVFMVMLYETPRWLVSWGRTTDARHSLRWLRGPSVDIEQEFQAAMAVQHVSTSLRETVREFRKRSVAVPLVLMIFVMFFQQAGGLNALASFAASLFQQAGVANPRITTAYAVGGVELATSLVVVFVIDLVGRKFLLILSGVGMTIGTLLLGVHFYLTRPSLCTSEHSFNSTLSSELSEDFGANVCNAQYGPLAIVSIMTFGVGFSIGWGPVPWILVSELTPLRVRGAASGIATLVNWGTAAVVVGFYSSYAEAVTTWFAWWSFTAINIAAVVFAALFLRETKGKSLEEIESHYQRNVL